jgi:dTDP-4-amino-4,6-dideoxygalactose transaminase
VTTATRIPFNRPYRTGTEPAAVAAARVHGPMDVTDQAAERLVRLPLWVGLTADDIARITGEIRSALGARRLRRPVRAPASTASVRKSRGPGV